MSQEQLNDLLGPLSDALGVPVDQVRVLVFLFLSFPMSFAFKQIRGEFVRYVTSLIFGVLFIYYTCGLFGVIHTLIASTIAYGLMAMWDRKTIGYTMFIYMFTYLSSYHIYRVYVNYLGWDMDASGPLMIVTIKLTMLAFNFSDGEKKDEDLTPFWKQNAVRELPGLLEYYSYVFFWVTAVTGPGFHFSEFKPFIDESLFKGKKYSTFKPFITVFLQAILCLGIFFVASLTFPFEWIYSDEFQQYNLIVKCLYVYVCLVGLRCRYYFTWKMAEASANLSGFGLRIDEKGNEHWDTVTNSHVLDIELAGNVRDITTFWNLKTAEWLKHYVYFRQVKVGAKVPDYANHLTMALSAFWHGFYPGYYLAFAIGAFSVDLMRRYRRLLRPIVVITKEDGKEVGVHQPQKLVYDIIAHFFTKIFFNYGMTAFLALSFERAIILYTRLYFFPHIFIIVGLVGSYILPSFLKRKKE
jgi:hypothetical protein